MPRREMIRNGLMLPNNTKGSEAGRFPINPISIPCQTHFIFKADMPMANPMIPKLPIMLMVIARGICIPLSITVL